MSKQELSYEEFQEWLISASDGEDVVYYTGLTVHGQQVRNAAYNAALGGMVFLYQTRVGDGIFNYHARRLSFKAGQLLKPRGEFVA